MITDTEIRQKGIEVLIAALGEVEAERFISLMNREPFDYTVWQKSLWQVEDLEQLSQNAMNFRNQDK
jgi:hypothetical protein